MTFTTSVGFYDRGVIDYYNTFRQMCEHGEIVETKGAKYLKWAVDDKLELWTTFKDGEAEMLFRSYYAGDARMTVGLIEKMPRRKSALSDGAFLCRSKAFAGAGWIAGQVPFVFDTPDFYRYEGLSLPRLTSVQLTGFAFRMTGFENEDAYDEAFPRDEDGYGWEPKHFIPAYMLNPRGEDGELQPASTQVSGFVLDTGIVTNSVTGLDFCWAKVETIGGEVDIVCSPDKLDGYLVTGGVATLDCYLFGRLVDDTSN